MANRRPFIPCRCGCGTKTKNRWGYSAACLRAAGIHLRPCGLVQGYGMAKSVEIIRKFLKLNEGRTGQPLLLPSFPPAHWNSGKRKAVKTTEIPCLSCKRDFNSAGPHNRICQCCKNGEDWRGGNIGDWNVGGLGGFGRFPSRQLPTGVR